MQGFHDDIPSQSFLLFKFDSSLPNSDPQARVYENDFVHIERSRNEAFVRILTPY